MASVIASETGMTLCKRRHSVLAPSYQLFYDEPLHFVSGEGSWLIDVDGERYLDCYNNVPSVGHGHPHVADAISKQSAQLVTNTRYLHDSVVDYAERLLAKMPSALDRALFTCTGSEALDLAVRVAMACTGNQGIIVTENAYHGVTKAVSDFSPSLIGIENLPGHVVTVPVPKTQGKHEAETFARKTQEAIASLKARGHGVALMAVDTICSSDGVRPGPAGFLAGALGAVHEAGGLFLADEVQAGFARTGEAFWGFERHGLQPDLVALGKPMGNGYPVAALILKAALASRFAETMRYFNTFGGNTVAMAAASAVLDVLEGEELQAHACKVGSVLLDGFRSIANEVDTIRDVRGVGFFLGIEIADPSRSSDKAFTNSIVQELKRKKVLVAATGPNRNVLKIRPPLALSQDDASFMLDGVRAVLKQQHTPNA